MSAQIVLFDLGNVVVDWQPLHLYKQIFETASEAEWFCDNVCTLAWHTEHDRGVSMAENAKPLIAQYPQYETQIRAWETRWFDMFNGYIPGMPALMAQLEERQVPLYGLTNMPADLAPAIFDRFPMMKILRDIVVSAVEKVVKPDPRIYQIVLERMGNPDPGSVLFIDDSEKNVLAARDMGLQAHHFTGAIGLERVLQEQGLL
ncbi:MAG: HAD family phosphatase [Pseudomonadota bacterium]